MKQLYAVGEKITFESCQLGWFARLLTFLRIKKKPASPVFRVTSICEEGTTVEFGPVKGEDI